MQDVGPAAWRALAAGSFYQGYEWLRSIEGQPGVANRLVLARDGERVVGALPCYASERGPSRRYDVHGVVRGMIDAAEAGDPDDWSPQLLVGAKAGYANRLLLDPELDPTAADEAVRTLLEGALAEGSGCAAAAMFYVGRPDVERILPHLGPRTAVLLLSGHQVLEVGWDDFDGYVRSLPSSRRSLVRRDLKAFASSGCELTTDRLRPRIDELVPLLMAVQQVHGMQPTVEEITDYLTRCAAGALDEKTVVFLCLRGGRPVAFALGYVHERRLFMRVFGRDYDATGPNAEYFQTLFYEPIRFAAEQHLDAIDFGIMAYKPKLIRGCSLRKLIRGCSLRPLWAVVFGPASGDCDWAATEASWNASAYRAWREECESLAGPLREEEWLVRRSGDRSRSIAFASLRAGGGS